jgi:hypothetical protein
MPNLMVYLRDWFHVGWAPAAGRLIWACLLTVIGLGITHYLISKPKAERPVTWAQAMLGAVGVFALLLLGYGVIPSEWITFSDKYLQWSTDKFVFRSSQGILGLPLKWPFSFTKQNVRDIIAAGIYGVFFGLNLVLFVQWQKRPTAAEVAARGEPTEGGTSKFGRPLRRFARAARGASS